MGEKDKNKFHARRLKIINKNWHDTIVIQHDLGAMVRKIFGVPEKKPDKPADVIPLKRDRD